MKITFVQPKAGRFWEPLWAGYIISFIKQEYIDRLGYVGNLDIKFFHGNFHREFDIIRESCKSDIVALSATTPVFEEAIRLAEKIRLINDNIRIVIGGWHPSAVGNSLEDKYSVIDDIIIGEGELPFLDILRFGGMYEKHYTSIKFDNLPWPDRKLILQDKTLDLCEKLCGERTASIQSRRGCPMRCVFCAEKIMTGDYPVRVRDPEDTLNEIEYIIDNWKVDRIKFVDPTWSYPKKATFDFCEAKIKRDNKIPFEAMIHAAFVTKDMLEIAKEAGCDQLNVGVESGSQLLLNDMKKGVTVDKIKKVFKWGKEFKINMRGFFLLGMPNESFETLEETRKLIKEINPDVFGMTLLTPFPGTNYYSEEYENVDWSNCDEYSNDFWKTKNFTNQELKDIQNEFNDEFKDILVSHQKRK